MTQARYKDKYKVESTRLPNRDYAADGWYFVTICTRQRILFFGDVSLGEVHLSSIGEIAQQFWLDIPNHFTHTYIDAYVIMPNHIHGIVAIARPYQDKGDRPPNVETSNCNVSTRQQFMSQISPKMGSLGTIVRSYKSAVIRWCNQNNFDAFGWQPRFYDQIIRADGSLDRIRQYIINNPATWTLEQENPANLWM